MRKSFFSELSEDQRGLSNAVVALLVISVSLAGGFVAYKAFYGYMRSSTANVSLRVTYLKALQVTGGSDYVSVNVKNTGMTRVEDVTVTVVNSDGPNIVMEVGDLEPGETGSGRSSGAAELAAGKTYPVEITANTPHQKGALKLALKVRVSS